MKEKVIIIVAVIITIALGIVIALNINKDDTEIALSQNIVISNKQSNVENKIENEDNVKENEIKQTPSEEMEENDISEEKNDMIEQPKTDLEKAINIAKKRWGADESVKFVNEPDDGLSEGEYIICVREKETTNALIWYKVNIKDESCEEW